MTPDEAVERVARILEPRAWRALGLCDTLAYQNRRISSQRKAGAVIAAIAAAPAPGDAWRPIETWMDAPRPEICDFWLDWADDVADLNPRLEDTRWASERQFRGRYGSWGSVYKATHWRHLPAPPASRRAQGAGA